MTDYVIPAPAALEAYNLKRYVASMTPKNNPFIKVTDTPVTAKGTYDTDNNFFMNEVILQAFEYQSFAVTTAPGPGGVTSTTIDYGTKAAPVPIHTFRILLDGENDLPPISYTHEWKEPDKSAMSDIFNSINELSTKVFGITDIVKGVTGKLDGDLPYNNKPIRKLDFQKIYKNSPYPGVELNFTSFTNNNFLEDVYDPIMTLIALTHPKRYTNTPTSESDKPLTTISNTASQVQDAVAQASQDLVEALALTPRQYTLQPPMLFNIFHQAGLYTYSNCMCSSISVSYSGPWYNTTISEQQTFDNLSQNSLIQNINRRSFPTSAKVSMKFESGERMTRDDFTTIKSNFKSIANSGNTTFTKFASDKSGNGVVSQIAAQISNNI
jgi:hypothetical protein